MKFHRQGLAAVAILGMLGGCSTPGATPNASTTMATLHNVAQRAPAIIDGVEAELQAVRGIPGVNVAVIDQAASYVAEARAASVMLANAPTMDAAIPSVQTIASDVSKVSLALAGDPKVPDQYKTALAIASAGAAGLEIALDVSK